MIQNKKKKLKNKKVMENIIFEVVVGGGRGVCSQRVLYRICGIRGRILCPEMLSSLVQRSLQKRVYSHHNVEKTLKGIQASLHLITLLIPFRRVGKSLPCDFVDRAYSHCPSLLVRSHLEKRETYKFN